MERLVGWESAVVRTDDGWIYRFSRLDFESFDREVAVLAAVDGKLGVATPRVERVDADHRVIAYRALTGYSLDLAGAVALKRSERHDLVESLATTLAAIHDLAGGLIEHLEIPDLDCSELVETISLVRPRLGGAQRSTLDDLVASWELTTLAHPGKSRALLHGDFHPGNMVFAAPTGALVGLWDFSCVERGDPAGDLRYLVGDSEMLTTEIVDAYHAITGRDVELEGARLIRVLEQISDAIEEGRPVEPVLHSWRSYRPGGLS